MMTVLTVRGCAVLGRGGGRTRDIRNRARRNARKFANSLRRLQFDLTHQVQIPRGFVDDFVGNSGRLKSKSGLQCAVPKTVDQPWNSLRIVVNQVDRFLAEQSLRGNG